MAPLNYRRRLLMIKPSQPGFRPWENRPTSLRSRKCIPPLVAGATTFPPRWEACHLILSRLRLPANPVPLPPQFGGAAKGKRLNGQARRLTSPDLHILCRMCTVDNKAPQSNPFTKRIAKNKVPPPGGRWWRQPPKGVHFRRPQGGCKGFIIRRRLL